jgi:hypothetical protein
MPSSNVCWGAIYPKNIEKVLQSKHSIIPTKKFRVQAERNGTSTHKESVGGIEWVTFEGQPRPFLDHFLSYPMEFRQSFLNA